MKAVLWPLMHLTCAYFPHLPSVGRSSVMALRWEALDSSGILPRLESCLKGHLVCSHSLLVAFPKQSAIRKNRLGPAEDEVSTPAGAPPDPRHGFYSHISCRSGENRGVVSRPLNVWIPLTVRRSGHLAEGLDLTGVAQSRWSKTQWCFLTSVSDVCQGSTQGPRCQRLWSLNASTNCFSLPLW